MRKKSVATKLIVNPNHTKAEFCDVFGTLSSFGFSNNLESESPKNSFLLDDLDAPPTFPDTTGSIALSDGTLVKPSCAEEAQGCSLHLSLPDGVLLKNPIIDTFPVGNGNTVRCTSCAVRISPLDCAIHPHLNVIVCKRCLKFYGKGDFAKDLDGKDENCRLCGDGGDLICCDVCPNTFCKSCIKRNLGKSFLQNIENLNDNESWNCLICDPSSLAPLQQDCFKVFELIKLYKDQISMWPNSKSNLPNPVMPRATDKAEKKESVKDLSQVLLAAKISDSSPLSNSNTSEWYLRNESVAEILNQISSITPPIIRPVIQSLRFCVKTFLSDINRAETNLSRAKTPEEVLATVRSFQSIYRFHLLGRIANVVSRVNGDLRNKSSTVLFPQVTKLTDTIDLTDDLEVTERSTNRNPPQEIRSSISPSSRQKRLNPGNCSTSLTKKRRKAPSVSHEDDVEVQHASGASVVVPEPTKATTCELGRGNIKAQNPNSSKHSNASVSNEMLCKSL